MEISVDIERCIGSGQCVLSAPQLFDQDDDDGTAVVLAQPEPRDEDDARQAARVCPGSAIALREP
jgi:ferredoxin